MRGMDALTASNFEDSLCLEKKAERDIWEGLDKMNRMAFGIIRSCLTQDMEYNVLYETSARKIWEIFKKKYLTKSIESRLHLKRRLYRFQLKGRLSISEHVNNYPKLIANLVNVATIYLGKSWSRGVFLLSTSRKSAISHGSSPFDHSLKKYSVRMNHSSVQELGAWLRKRIN